MKVPIYKRQTGPVKSGGQAMLTATADPGMIGSAAVWAICTAWCVSIKQRA